MADLSPLELMNLQLEAGFTYAPELRLRMVNEPWDGTVPAPRFLLGRTVDGKTFRRYRHDLAGPLVEKLESLSATEDRAVNYNDPPRYMDKYLEILGEEKFSMGPNFFIPPGSLDTGNNPPVVRLARENIGNYFIEGFEWLVDEIDLVQPCAALICENRIVSQCRSVRVSPKAHEAGLETLPAFRGRGYALLVTRFWAKAVREMGAVPLYSTSWKNTVSQRVAGKLKLYHYGNTFSAG